MELTTDGNPQVRYIKLGRGGGWTERCLAHGEMRFGHPAVPHELALSGDRQVIIAHLMAVGRSPAKQPTSRGRS